MRLTRRALLAAPLAAPALVRAQARPALGVFAAGQPAAVLIQALRPDALLGWPRPLPVGALAALRPELARLPVLGELNAAGQTANLEALLARRPTLVLDYGQLGPRYQEAAQSVRRRTGLAYLLIDGRLERTPAALLEAGRLLNAEPRATQLAAIARDLLAEWRAQASRHGPRFYYGRGPDGLEAGLPGSLATEVLEGAGWRNVARGGASRGLARVALEQVLSWDPEVVVTLESTFANAARSDPRWRTRRGRGRRDIVLLPALPFGWIDRPPSLNRLLGCAWTTLGGRTDGRALAQVVRDFHVRFYGRDPGASAALALARSSQPA